ncbi:glycerophosphodiester phosphodiesterase [Vampirovibrio sp.]|uniref:glycerophosphodiester phosphodiesterase n=1 Tax=Vampirovibrio sp. TaxID=2717857 RepID=UPI00359393C4
MLGHFETTRPAVSVVGHRGATTHREPARVMPENTIPAFVEAHRQGAAIELDVMSTQDGKVVVHHDFKTGRMFRLPSVQKKVRNTTWKELQYAEFNAKEHERSIRRLMGPATPYKSPQAFEKLQVPALEAVLDRLPEARFYIELKTVAPFGNGDLEKKVARIIQERKLEDRVTVLSFSPVSLRKIKRHNPKIHTALNVDIPPFIKQNALLLKGFVNVYAKGLAKANAIQPSYSDVTPGLVQTARSAGMPLVAWASGETREEERQKFPKLLAMGVNGLITNAVDLLNEVIKKQPD